MYTPGRFVLSQPGGPVERSGSRRPDCSRAYTPGTYRANATCDIIGAMADEPVTVTETLVVPASPATPPEPDGPSEFDVGAAIGLLMARSEDHETRLARVEAMAMVNHEEIEAVSENVEDVAATTVQVADAAVANAEATAEVAAVVEEIATEPVVEIEPEPEPDEPPGKEHWFKRSMSEWLGGNR